MVLGNGFISWLHMGQFLVVPTSMVVESFTRPCVPKWGPDDV